MTTKHTITSVLASLLLTTGNAFASPEDVCSALKAGAETAATEKAVEAEKIAAEAQKAAAKAKQAADEAQEAAGEAKQAAAEKTAAENAAAEKADWVIKLGKSNPEAAQQVAQAKKAAAEAEKAAAEAEKAAAEAEKAAADKAPIEKAAAEKAAEANNAAASAEKAAAEKAAADEVAAEKTVDAEKAAAAAENANAEAQNDIAEVEKALAYWMMRLNKYGDSRASFKRMVLKQVADAAKIFAESCIDSLDPRRCSWVKGPESNSLRRENPELWRKLLSAETTAPQAENAAAERAAADKAAVEKAAAAQRAAAEAKQTAAEAEKTANEAREVAAIENATAEARKTTADAKKAAADKAYWANNVIQSNSETGKLAEAQKAADEAEKAAAEKAAAYNAAAKKAAQAERIAGQAEKAAAEAAVEAEKAAAEAKETATQAQKAAALKADAASDVVAQVLNYSIWGNDEGSGGSFWYKEQDCRYKLCDPKPTPTPNSTKNAADVFVGILTALAKGYLSPKEIDLNSLDPKSISVSQTLVDNTHCWNVYPDEYTSRNPYQRCEYQPPTTSTSVTYEGRELIKTIATVDPERIKRGWTLIYSDYCKGTSKPF